MKNKKYFLIFSFVGVVIFVFVLLSFYFLKSFNFLNVYFFDVGQGDAALIRTPEHKNILIDGGPNNLILSRLGKVLPFYVRQLDYIIISHFHDDHIIGLVEVLKRYRVGKIILASSNISSPVIDNLLVEIRRQKLTVINIENTGRLQLDNYCSLFFINPESLKIKANENNSLVSKLDCENNKFLFAGDNEAEAETALIASGFDLRAEIFKSSHHGSKTSNTEEFLNAINPKKIVISVGHDNHFGHPSPEVLERVINKNIEVVRTDILGTIHILANIQ